MTRAVRTWAMETSAVPTKVSTGRMCRWRVVMKIQTHLLQLQLPPQQLPLQFLQRLKKSTDPPVWVHQSSLSFCLCLWCLWGNRWRWSGCAVLKSFDWISNVWFQESHWRFKGFQKQQNRLSCRCKGCDSKKIDLIYHWLMKPHIKKRKMFKIEDCIQCIRSKVQIFMNFQNPRKVPTSRRMCESKWKLTKMWIQRSQATCNEHSWLFSGNTYP